MCLLCIYIFFLFFHSLVSPNLTFPISYNSNNNSNNNNNNNHNNNMWRFNAHMWLSRFPLLPPDMDGLV